LIATDRQEATAMSTTQPSPTDRTPSPSGRPRRAIAVALAAAAAALLGTGCGSASPTGSSTGAGASSQKSFVASAFRYSRCMRSHGLANFPDPKVSSSPGHSSVAVAVGGPPSPAMNAAEKACHGLLPKGGPNQAQQAQQDRVHKAALLAFARCLRSHGVPGFPDPTVQGQLSPQMLASAGVNLKAPGFLHAALGCVGVTHGAITAAQVAQAVNHG
jgi:hypothetical protein